MTLVSSGQRFLFVVFDSNYCENLGIIVRMYPNDQLNIRRYLHTNEFISWYRHCNEGYPMTQNLLSKTKKQKKQKTWRIHVGWKIPKVHVRFGTFIVLLLCAIPLQY